MSKICFFTKKRPIVGSRIHRKGQSKKSGGIGMHITKRNRRIFKPNLQRIYIKFPSGKVKKTWVSVKAIKSGKVEKIIKS